jgi:two-component system cell cycle response regulator
MKPPEPKGPAAKAVENTNVKTFVVQPANRSNQRTRAVLTVTTGLDAGRVVSVETGALVTIGRSDDCVICLGDVSLSRVHARIMCVTGDYLLADAGSTNGTFLNGARVERPVALRDGDRIELGANTVLRFSLVDAEEEQQMKAVYEAAVRDALTGVFNRKQLEERLDSEVAFATRSGMPLGLIILDIDFFKKVNDTYGHPGGDAVLKATAALIQRSVRGEDFVARYGGEEFVIIARGLDTPQSAWMADRLRQAIEATPVPFDVHVVRVTSSFGVASLAEVAASPTKQALLTLADQRLYASKQGGRNRVTYA